MKDRKILDERIEQIKWKTSYKIKNIILVSLTVLIIMKGVFFEWDIKYYLSDILLLLLICILQIENYLNNAILHYKDEMKIYILKLICQAIISGIIFGAFIIFININRISLNGIFLKKVIPVVFSYIIFFIGFNFIIRKTAKSKSKKLDEEIESEE